MNPSDDLSYEYVSQILRYDSSTGKLFWRGKPRVEAGSHNKSGTKTYKHIRIGRKRYYAHRLAWLLHTGEWPKKHIDHIDGNGLNNSINNLRDVSASDNHKNKRMGSRNKSGVVGVHFDKGRKKWRAQIRSCGKLIDLGLAENIFEAACMRKSAEVKHSFHKNHGTTRG